jgi:hypothetical protein
MKICYLCISIANFTCLALMIHYLSLPNRKLHERFARPPCYFIIYRKLRKPKFSIFLWSVIMNISRPRIKRRSCHSHFTSQSACYVIIANWDFPLLYSVQACSGTHPVSYPMANGAPSLEVKWPGVKPSTAEVKNGEALPPLPHVLITIPK